MFTDDEATTGFGETPEPTRSTWFKIADFPGCVDMVLLPGFDGLAPPKHNRWTVALPPWLPSSDHAVLRWEWYSVQQVVDIEFFVSCVDVRIAGTNEAHASAIAKIAPTVAIAGATDHLPSDIAAYRKAYDGEFGPSYLVGPSVATYNSSVPAAPPPPLSPPLTSTPTPSVPPPSASLPSSSPPPSAWPPSTCIPAVAQPIGWCSTTWADVAAGRVTCYACASAADCPGDRVCHAGAWCSPTKLCGDSSEAACGDRGGCSERASPSPSPPPSLSPLPSPHLPPPPSPHLSPPPAVSGPPPPSPSPSPSPSPLFDPPVTRPPSAPLPGMPAGGDSPASNLIEAVKAVDYAFQRLKTTASESCDIESSTNACWETV